MIKCTNFGSWREIVSRLLFMRFLLRKLILIRPDRSSGRASNDTNRFEWRGEESWRKTKTDWENAEKTVAETIKMHKKGNRSDFCSSYFILMVIINHFYDIYASKIKFKGMYTSPVYAIKVGFSFICANICNQESRLLISLHLIIRFRLPSRANCTRKTSRRAQSHALAAAACYVCFEYEKNNFIPFQVALIIVVYQLTMNARQFKKTFNFLWHGL